MSVKATDLDQPSGPIAGHKRGCNALALLMSTDVSILLGVRLRSIWLKTTVTRQPGRDQAQPAPVVAMKPVRPMSPQPSPNNFAIHSAPRIECGQAIFVEASFPALCPAPKNDTTTKTATVA